jgi:hypothetical protein
VYLQVHGLWNHGRQLLKSLEVIQITGTDENIKEIQNFCGRWSFKRDAHLEIDNNYSVETIEGIMSCHKGDWIVKGVEGEV